MCSWGQAIGQALGGVAQIGATLQQTKTILAAGKFNQKMYQYQASLNESRARRAVEAGDIASTEAQDQMRQMVGSGRAAYAASGLLLDGASTDAPNLWEQDQAAMLAYEQAGIRDAANMEAWGFRSQAAMDRAQARFAKTSAYAQARAGGYSNLASSIQGAGSMAASFSSK